MSKSRNRHQPEARLTAKNVTKALISAIELRELTLVDWEYIKETIDTKYELIEKVPESFTDNKFIKWLFGY